LSSVYVNTLELITAIHAARFLLLQQHCLVYCVFHNALVMETFLAQLAELIK